MSQSVNALGWDKNVSVKRVGGFTLNWLWILMLFYSIVPYLHSSDVRGSLYVSLFVSLCASVVTMVFISIIVRPQDRIGSNKFIVLGAALMTCLGTVLTMTVDLATTSGMLVLGISGVMTGSASAVLFVGWIERLSGNGGRVALVEMSAATCAAFAGGFVLITIPPLFANIVSACLPLASAAVLVKTTLPHEPAVSTREQLPSRQTVALFLKALLGAALIGVLEGFFDVLSGYRTYEVQDIYGTYLFLGGFLTLLLLLLLAVFLCRDGVFHAYRFSMLLLCLGCLLTPFLTDNNTYSTALIFGGYSCFIVTLCVVCIDVSASFRVGITRAIALGFVALYGGEIIGSSLAHGIEVMGVSSLDLAIITLVAVSVLFISHLFLFTETDLVKLGLGEINMMVRDEEEAPDDVVLQEPVDPCIIVVDKYALSPRESDVLPLLLQGRTISRIQESLFISAGTVSTHIRHIYQKTGVNNRQELIDLAQELVDESEQAG